MKVYTAGLIVKSLRSLNAALQKKLTSDYRKTLRIPRSAVSSQELNTFIVLSGEKNGKGTFDPNLIEKIEQGSIYNRFRTYYNNNESKLQRDLKSNQELRETSQIIKDFIIINFCFLF